ncbi:MerR family transcriptional regulator [Alkalibacillus silvisoli]|uniref:DUF3967 domain-containing protein n=1 Tax=Alkalibacillus silvisoli TaxID=392823 RepID=A0ABN1AC69_9BACI
MSDQYYPSKEVCDRLNVSSSTLRKWCLALEKKEYEFARTEQNRRLFQDHDLQALESLKELIQDRNMTLENASIIVVSRFQGERSSTRTPSVREPKNTHDFEELGEIKAKLEEQQEYMMKQEQFNAALMEKLDQQQKYINNRLDERDQALMQTLNQISEERKEQAKLLEEQKQKEGWFSKLFNKK